MRLRALLAHGLLALSGCAAQPKPAPCVLPAPEPVPTAPSEPRAPFELAFRLRTGSAADSVISSEPHAFSAGAWECALGPTQSADEAVPDGTQLRRARRVACTHASGATVESTLGCALRVPTTADQAGEAQRELALGLSSAPAVVLGCDAVPNGPAR